MVWVSELTNTGCIPPGSKRRSSTSVSLRLEQHQFGNVDGADPEMNPEASPAVDSRAQGGERTLAGVGANFQFAGALSGHRLGVEYLQPIRERLDGPQMSLDRTLTVAWEYAW